MCACAEGFTKLSGHGRDFRRAHAHYDRTTNYGFFAGSAAGAATAAESGFTVVSTTAGAGAAAAVSAAGASSFLAQAARTSTAATRAIRFIEMISRWGTRIAQRETASWYAVLGRAEITDRGRIVKTFGMHHRGERMPMRYDDIWSASGKQTRGPVTSPPNPKSSAVKYDLTAVRATSCGRVPGLVACRGVRTPPILP